MRIGVPRETKEGEARVGLIPRDVAVLTADDHDARVQSGAGSRIAFDDDAYRAAGARIVSPAEAWEAELVVKVKELQDADFANVRGPQTIFGFHHLAGEPQRTRRLAAAGVTAIAFEMVRDAGGTFSMLAPMSAIAGRMAIEVGTKHLGHAPANVLVLGAGPAGSNAAEAARAAGAKVTVLRRADATPQAVERAALEADLVVGAVFVAGERTPKLLSRSLVSRMRRGAMIVDVSIEEGGVAETSRSTTHAQPTYVEEGVIHYCVGNMPAAKPLAAADALSAAALPYVRELASMGIGRAVRDNPALRGGVLIWKGRVNHEGIAREAGLPYTSLTDRDLDD
ncbi:MAG TPA: alanine dehydrogenase [Usitatibacter sp.]